MVRVILKRIGLAFLTLFGVTVIVFALLQMMPGEPIDSIVPLDASEELRQVIIDQYGFDQPLYMQYFMWLGNAVRGNFGNSVSDNRLVLSVVSEALHNTLILALGASVFAFPAGALSLPCGRRNSVSRPSCGMCCATAFPRC